MNAKKKDGLRNSVLVWEGNDTAKQNSYSPEEVAEIRAFAERYPRSGAIPKLDARIRQLEEEKRLEDRKVERREDVANIKTGWRIALLLGLLALAGGFAFWLYR